MRNTVLVVAALAASLSVANAQTRREFATDEAALTQLVEAMRTKQWNVALVAFSKIENRTSRTVMLSAQASYELGAWDNCADALDVVLDQDDEHLAALYLLARVRVRQSRVDDAKTILCGAAALGHSVLRDLSDTSDKKLFSEMLNDPKFLIRLIRREQGTNPISFRGLRDPFATPVRKLTPEDLNRKVYDGDAASMIRTKALEERIDTLFGTLHEIASNPVPDFDVLRSSLADLRVLLDELARQDDGLVSSRLPKLEAQFEGLRHMLQPLRMELYVADGNQHLRSMAKLIRDDQFDEALERYGLLQELCEQMRGEPLEVFHGNADQLMLRGDQLARRARLELWAAKMPLEVTGIVLASASEENSAVINDRIYEAGDEIIDPATDEPILDLVLVEITRNTVRFRLSELEFIRALKRRN